ncbi:hypothetical protein BBO_04531 [Beauveria brongniartii RCEF 3172]|uniref:Uncharacterized protein n=1 Tax=Beauveria brongniartii RCEF 3172 TaxID=1081107 RepID=A0A162JF41_9HYPO|nr:hypothetical protein BBO_04531 [Beauveria brongniartii RCEF 3172]
MRATTILAIISGAGALSMRAECPTSSGSACGIVAVLGQTVGYPKCNCKTTCSGPVSFSGISAVVSLGPDNQQRLSRKESIIKTFVASLTVFPLETD